MQYNFTFEIAAIAVLCTVLYDYNNKMKVFRLDAVLFKYVIYAGILESVANLVSSVCLAYGDKIPVSVNVFVATLFFVLQATKIYALAGFSFAYMNPHISFKNKGFIVLTAVNLVNLVLSITTPLTGFYFVIGEGGYQQGFGTNLGYYYYLINVVLCLFYALRYSDHLLSKDMWVAVWVAIVVAIGVCIQFNFRTVLMIDLSVAIAVLYLYLTLENPNDYQDKLTLCGNEYGFKVFIDYRCQKKKEFTVLSIDLDKFHYINSMYGVEIGDELLQRTAVYLEKLFQSHVVFRVHNDLFAVVMQGKQEQAAYYVTKLQKRFDEIWKLTSGHEIMLDAAITICEYPRYFGSHTELENLQRDMMKKIKSSHEQQVLYSNQELTDTCRRQEHVERVLRKAIALQELEVYYQPIIDSNKGTVSCLEALSRLQDEEIGIIPPDEFITVAESTGQIISLGFYVFEEVCRFIQKNLMSNPANTVESVHVNLSSIQCMYPQLSSRLKEMMKKYEIPGSKIHLELTESSMVDSPELMRETMEKMMTEGCGFSLDDYGTGYSNISYLIQFPFEKIKFDKHMTWSYFESDEARLIMQKEFDILQTLKKEIIAEGIETREQFLEMQSKGIHFFQGYYFSKPLTEKDCVRFLEEFKMETASDR